MAKSSLVVLLSVPNSKPACRSANHLVWVIVLLAA